MKITILRLIKYFNANVTSCVFVTSVALQFITCLWTSQKSEAFKCRCFCKVCLANHSERESRKQECLKINRYASLSLNKKWTKWLQRNSSSFALTYWGFMLRVFRIPVVFRIIFIYPLHIQRDRFILLILPHALPGCGLLLCAVEIQELLTWTITNTSRQTLFLCSGNTTVSHSSVNNKSLLNNQLVWSKVFVLSECKINE